MSDTSVRNVTIGGIASEILTRGGDLIEKEIQLAKAELAENITAKLTASVWMGAAAFCGFLTLLLVIEGIVFVLIRAGLTGYWASFIVAAVIAIIGGLLYLKGRAASSADLLPKTAVRNINRDIKTAKEQLT